MNKNSSSIVLGSLLLAGWLGMSASPCLCKADGRDGFWKHAAQGAPDLEVSRKRQQANPNDADANNDLGWALRQNGNLTEAEKFLRQAIKLNEKMPQPHSNLSVVLQDQKKFAPALVEARKAVALDPGQAIFQVVLGNALSNTDDFKNAEAQYQQAIKLKPDYENAHYNLGRVLLLDGQNAAAQGELSVALGLDPSDDRALELMDKMGTIDPSAAAHSTAAR